MGCFSIPKNKSKVAAASQQAEQQYQKNYNCLYHGAQLEQVLSSGLSSGLSSNKPVMLPNPDDLSGRQSEGSGPIPAPTGLRGGGKQQKHGQERGGSTTITPSGSFLKNSSARLSNNHPHPMSAPSCYHSFPPSNEDRRILQARLQGTKSDDNNLAIPFSACLPYAKSDNNRAFPFSAPSSRPSTLDGNSSPARPQAVPVPGSPLHNLISSVSVSELDQLLSSGLSGYKPVMLPNPDDLPEEQLQGTWPQPAQTGFRGGQQQQQQQDGEEEGGIPVVSSSASLLRNSSAKLIRHNPRALSAPVNYHSYPPSSEDRRILQARLRGTKSSNNNSSPFSAPLPSVKSDNNRATPFSAPLPSVKSDNNRATPFSAPLPSRHSTLDGNSSPARPQAVHGHGSPLRTFISSASVSEVVNRSPQLGAKAFIDRKPGLFTGRPVRLPKPQPATAHPLPLPPLELDEAPATGSPAGFSTSHVASISVFPSPSRGKG